MHEVKTIRCGNCGETFEDEQAWDNHKLKTGVINALEEMMGEAFVETRFKPVAERLAFGHSGRDGKLVDGIRLLSQTEDVSPNTSSPEEVARACATATVDRLIEADENDQLEHLVEGVPEDLEQTVGQTLIKTAVPELVENNNYIRKPADEEDCYRVWIEEDWKSEQVEIPVTHVLSALPTELTGSQFETVLSKMGIEWTTNWGEPDVVVDPEIRERLMEYIPEEHA